MKEEEADDDNEDLIVLVVLFCIDFCVSFLDRLPFIVFALPPASFDRIILLALPLLLVPLL